MGKWVLYTQLNYAHPKPTHLTPLENINIITVVDHKEDKKEEEDNSFCHVDI